MIERPPRPSALSAQPTPSEPLTPQTSLEPLEPLTPLTHGSPQAREASGARAPHGAPEPNEAGDASAWLDPLTLPLHGSQLMEASAGTGKTWTIAALYLRLILGHGCARPLLPGEILVMTFTKAATRELVERIRQRLVQAAARFRGEAAARTEPEDSFLTNLLEAHPAGPSRQAAAWRLGLAAEAMDEAAIHTIDAWCQRMLREHAFDSGSLFDEALQAHEAALLAQALRDYWRQQVYPLEGPCVDVVLAQWSDPAALQRNVQPLLQNAWPDRALAQTLLEHAGVQRWVDAVAALKHGWVEGAQTMLAWLQSQWALEKACPLNQAKLRRSSGEKWLAALRGWAQSTASTLPDLANGRHRLTRAGLEDATRKNCSLVIPSVFDDFGDLMDQLEALPDLRTAMRQHAATHVQARLAQLKSQAGLFGFADLLNRLDAALDGQQHGANAERLRERIVAQYPVAMIDEFQDTSPVQLRIFDRLYRIASNEPTRALLMIGDPKQAIYGFRGADIYSYLFAREATRGRHHALGVNHRSTTALVGAVNHLFLTAENRPGAGAFLFRPAAAGAPTPAASPLPFVAVNAEGLAQRLVSSAGELPALSWVVDESLRNGQDSLQLLAAHCAEQIVRLLNDPQAGFAAAAQPLSGANVPSDTMAPSGPSDVIDANGQCASQVRPAPPGLQRLQPADVAVLVSNGHQAEAVRQALRDRGVASVYLSDKDSVFQTQEAADVLRLLQAVAAPRDARLAHAALATPLLGLSLPTLLTLAQDDPAFDDRCEALEELQHVWKTQGILALVRRALHAFDLPARWLASEERRLTNVLHLAELLQSASTQVPGEQALMRWLAQQIQDSEEGLNGGEDVVLRLESDAQLVQVVTVHKSKGLQYPLVFLPFVALVRTGRNDFGRDAAFWLPTPAHAGVRPGRVNAKGDGPDTLAPPEVAAQQATPPPTLVLAPTPAQIEQKRTEDLREQTRLLYVALTRAQHALWVGLAGVGKPDSTAFSWHDSAIGSLISGREKGPAEQRLDDLRALAAGCPGMRVQTVQSLARPPGPRVPDKDPLPLPTTTALAPRAAPPELSAARPYQAAFDRSWAISSYSALVRDAAWEPGQAMAWNDRVWRDDESGMVAEAFGGGLADGAAASTGALSGEAGDASDAALDVQPGSVVASLAGSTAVWHQFPRGALAGNFLHDQLEWLAGEGFALHESPTLQQALQRRCERQGWGHRAAEVLTWLQRVCSTPLPALAAQGGGSASLAQLRSLAPEMEFWFPSSGLSARQVDALCCQHLLPGQPRPALPERQLKGLLMGFADLVVEHGGRYWVLDYKSNVLGPRDADYHPRALEVAVLEHRYDVQAALYLLALHRLLKARLGPSYKPEHHLGGAITWFLRGVNSAHAGCCHLAPPLALLSALDAVIDAPSELTSRATTDALRDASADAKTDHGASP